MALELSHEVLIGASVEDTFRACDSREQQLAWVGSLVEVRIESEEEWGEGSRFVQIHEEAGSRQALEGVILGYEPGERIHMKLEHPDFTLESVLRFEDQGGLTRVSQQTLLELRSAKLKFVASMVEGVVARRISEDLERLKALLESA